MQWPLKDVDVLGSSGSLRGPFLKAVGLRCVHRMDSLLFFGKDQSAGGHRQSARELKIKKQWKSSHSLGLFLSLGLFCSVARRDVGRYCSKRFVFMPKVQSQLNAFYTKALCYYAIPLAKTYD